MVHCISNKKDVINGRFLAHKELHKKYYKTVIFHNCAIKKKKQKKNTFEGIEKYLKQGCFKELLQNTKKFQKNEL